ncbi:MAG: YjbQ family protein [Ignavibacteriales bacterium]|nr:MAG: YjbQ family protein [Ignavibacteriales bacterium]
MEIKTNYIERQTKGYNDIIDITAEVQEIISDSGFTEGSVLLFVVGSTGALTTIEYEPGLKKDLPELMERLIPSNKTYHHDNTWHDGNGYAHLRASLQGPSLTIPFSNSQLILGTWQQIILIDYDNRPRKRKVVVQLTGI